jgi:hypothetical protein
MPYLFLAGQSIRNETSQQRISNLTRKGWSVLAEPPYDPATQYLQPNNETGRIDVIDIPPAPPDYEGFAEALGESTAITNAVNAKLYPNIRLSNKEARAQAGGLNTLRLATTASPGNNDYNGSPLLVTGGTGAGEVFAVTGYIGATKDATLRRISGDGTPFTLDGTTRYLCYSLDEIFTGIGRVAVTFEIGKADLRLEKVLNSLVARGDRGNQTIINRFKARLTDWVTAVNFAAPERTELQGLVDTYLPTVRYTVPPAS